MPYAKPAQRHGRSSRGATVRGRPAGRSAGRDGGLRNERRPDFRRRTGPVDSIDVARADGIVAEFAIDSASSVPKCDFPTLEVDGNLDHSGLWLITCGGEIDPTARSSESNIIAFASLIGSRPA